MSIFQKVCLTLTIIGALNWGLVGLFDFNLVTFIFGDLMFLSRTVFTLVGLAGIANIALLSVPTE